MADTPDPQELARRYLDIWQQHLTQAATDPELATAMAKFWQNLPTGMTSGIPGWPPAATNTGMTNTGMTNTGASHNDTAGSEAAPGSESGSTSGSTSGSAPDPATSDGGSTDLDKLHVRMAALEKRLEALEPKPRTSRKRAAKGPGKRKS